MAAVLKLPIKAYQAGSGSKDHSLPASQGTADASTSTAGTRLRDWARWMDENVDVVTGALDKLANFIVGPAITIEPMVRDRKGRLLERVNDNIRRVLLDESIPGCWSRDVSVTGEYTRGEQEWTACRSWLRDGEVFARRVTRRASADAVPHLVQLIEPDWCPMDLVRLAEDGTGAIVQGIEKDSWGRPIRYHFYRRSPADIWLSGAAGWVYDTETIPADQVEHLKYARRRIRQTRGVPIFHAAIFRLDDVATFEEAYRIAAKIGAHIIGAIHRSPDTIAYDGSGMYSTQSDTRARQGYWDMEHGQILSDLLPGENLNWYKPEIPNPDATPFIDDQLRRAAAGFGLGYSTFAGKYDKAFSAARQEQSENWPNIETLRAQFISDFVRPVEYEPALRAAILAGRLSFPREADPLTYFSADFRGPSRPTIDDEKQANADRTLLETKMDSRWGRIRERGRDPSRVDIEISDDTYQLNMPGAAPPPGQQAADNGTDDEQPI
jgi:lambda family phage portal protein